MSDIILICLVPKEKQQAERRGEKQGIGFLFLQSHAEPMRISIVSLVLFILSCPMPALPHVIQTSAVWNFGNLISKTSTHTATELLCWILVSFFPFHLVHFPSSF